jgi:hypothetical protein
MIYITGVFQAIEYKMLMDTNLYVDGGVICNYPLHCFDGRLINIRETEGRTIQRNWLHWGHKKQVEDKQNQKHITICICHHHTQDTRRKQTKQNTQYDMYLTPPYTRYKTKTNKTKKQHNMCCKLQYSNKHK